MTALEAIIIAWIRKDAPVSVKMSLMPEHVRKLSARIVEALPPELGALAAPTPLAGDASAEPAGEDLGGHDLKPGTPGRLIQRLEDAASGGLYICDADREEAVQIAAEEMARAWGKLKLCPEEGSNEHLCAFPSCTCAYQRLPYPGTTPTPAEPPVSPAGGEDLAKLSVRLKVDSQVLLAAEQMGDEQRKQPEWLWYEDGGLSLSFGRWSKVAGAVPYIRADLALLPAASRPDEQGEPVAWMYEYEFGNGWAPHSSVLRPQGPTYRDVRPLYAHPAPAASRPEVGREEIAKRWWDRQCPWDWIGRWDEAKTFPGWKDLVSEVYDDADALLALLSSPSDKQTGQGR